MTKLSYALQKQIVLALDAAAAGDPDNAISAIAGALKLEPDSDTRKLLERANEELSIGSVVIAVEFLNMAFYSACKLAPVQTGSLNPSGVKLVGARIAELERKNAELVDALENLTTTGEQCFSDLLSMGRIPGASGSAYRWAKQSAGAAIASAKGEN